MTPSRLLVLPLFAVAWTVAGLSLAAPAQATTVDDVVRSLRSTPVYVDPQAELRTQVDAKQIGDAIQSGTAQVFVAVLPSAAARNSGGLRQVALRIDQQLGAGSVLLAVAGKEFTGVAGPSSGLCSGEAGRIMGNHDDAGDVDGSFTSAVSEVQKTAGQGSAGRCSSGNGAGSSSGDTGGGSGGAVLLGLLALVAVGGGAFLYTRSRRRRINELEGARADVESLYNRLGNDVSTLSAGEDATARQALADASERYSATGALLSKSDTPGEFAAARRTAIEGLTAARVARAALGLDPGPEIPPPPGAGPQLTDRQTMRVGDRDVDGSPEYEPGRSHYFGGGMLGGRMVPGGWYSFPFWETMLMGSVLTGGFGGGDMFGGGWGGGGYERGYEEGAEDAGDNRGDSGGGSGDWGGGGGGFGDWGGGGGGGDWGGGGGGGDGGGGGW